MAANFSSSLLCGETKSEEGREAERKESPVTKTEVTRGQCTGAAVSDSMF